MALSFPASITGAAQTGLTTPGYGLTADSAPDNFGNQRAVTSLTGTQAGVDVHSISRPFTLTWVRPRKLKVLNANASTTAVLTNVGSNEWVLIARKGVSIAPNQPPKIATCRFTLSVPAGADINDPASVRALLSAFIGELNYASAGIGDTGVSGIV